MRACVVVVGDIGRSPRMRFHALSLASHGVEVDLVGQVESELPSAILNEPRIRVIGLHSPPRWLDKAPRSIALLGKLLLALLTLLFTLLFRIPFPRLLLLQNPPGVPALPVCWLVCLLKRARLVIDWHNYTYSILEWEQGPRAKAVSLAKSVEAYFGPKATANLCVTHAMRADLLNRWGVKAITLYDRPPSHVTFAYTVADRHEFYLKMAQVSMYPVFMSDSVPPHLTEVAEITSLSYRKKEGGEPKLRSDRPALLVSGTSWTPDEDFGLLLSALEKYDAMAAIAEQETNQRLPRILAVITGKGPLKAHYAELIQNKRLERVDFLLPWLAAEDYPRLLASSDLGVSLHASTSGLDLPMKVVDMFGAGLPVLAKRFACVEELVRPGDNGHLFNTPQELANLLSATLRGFPDSPHCRLPALTASLRDLPLVSWEDNWDANFWPLVQSLS